jgi:hypothetical protein
LAAVSATNRPAAPTVGRCGAADGDIGKRAQRSVEPVVGAVRAIGHGANKNTF